MAYTWWLMQIKICICTRYVGAWQCELNAMVHSAKSSQFTWKSLGGTYLKLKANSALASHIPTYRVIHAWCLEQIDLCTLHLNGLFKSLTKRVTDIFIIIIITVTTTTTTKKIELQRVQKKLFIMLIISLMWHRGLTYFVLLCTANCITVKCQRKQTMN